MTEDDKTPIGKRYIFRFISRRLKNKTRVDWAPGTVLEDIYWFNLKRILNTHGYEQASKIINSIKRHLGCD